MCQYCNFDVFTHYLLNNAPLLEDESIQVGENIGDRSTIIASGKNNFIPEEEVTKILVTPNNNKNPTTTNTVTVSDDSFPGAPEFDDNSWDFAGGNGRLYRQVAIVDRAFKLTFPNGIFQDADAGDILTYSATLADGNPLPSWLGVNSTTGVFTGIPDSIGNLDIKLIATDTSGASASIKFNLDVLNNTAANNSNPGGVTNNLQLWLRGDAGVVANNGSVSAWLDQSSNSFYASQGITSYRPTINNYGLNGKPTLNFSASTLLNRGLLGDHLDVAFNSKLNPNQFTAFIINSVDGGQGKWRASVSSESEATNNKYGYGFYANNSNKWYLETGTGSGWNSVSNASTIPNEWEIVTGSYNGTNSRLLLDGKEIANSAKTYLPNTSEALRIGGGGDSYFGDYPFQGDIAEVIIFDSVLGTSDRNKVESYLAVKYGLSLDQTTATNYSASDGSVWWNASTAGTYKYNIAGVVSDSGSNLVQTESSSSNLDGIVTVELKNVAELANGESFFWSDDGVSAKINNLSTDVPLGYDGRLAKIWQVAETGEVGDVTLSFDLSGLGYSTFDVNEFALLVDSNNTFNDASIFTNGRSITDQNISFTNLDLDAGQYFTLATTNIVNQNPTGTNKTVTTNEDITYSFTATNFGFNDSDAGDSLVKVLITTLPQHGTLKLNNVAVTKNQTISFNDIPNLTFTPSADQFGEEYTSFEFKVNDGEAYSLDANKITVTVNPVIDAAEIASTQTSDVDNGTVVDVMIVYTQGALDEAGGLANFNREIDEEVDLLNEALVRSGVNFTVKVVHRALVAGYVGVDNGTDLGRLNNSSDGYMDEIHGWRNEYSADLVSLITTGPGTGIAYQPGEFNAQSYGVRYNLDHEIGHNLGSAHDVYTGGNPTTGIAGYKSLEERIATVMSYAQGGATWTQTFSSPNLIIRDVPFGSNEANNVARMNSRAIISSNFRHSNDNLAKSAEITGSGFSLTALNSNATKETNELNIANNTSGKSVWWSWTAPNSNPVQVTTQGSNFDTLLAVYTGTDYSNLQLVTENNDTGTGTISKVAFTPVAGETYKIAVAGKNSTSGQIQLNFETLPSLPVVSINVTDNQASEAGLNTGSFRLQRNNTSGNLTVNLALTGTKGSRDYLLSVGGSQLTSNSVIIPDGKSFVDVLVTPIDDNATEIGGETLTVEVVSDLTTYIPANAPNNRGSITIADNDNASPGGLDTNNLQLWLDGNSQVDINNNTVTGWRDRSSTGIDLGQNTINNRPNLQNNGLNYNSVISFDGTNDTLISINQLPADFATKNASIFIVSKSDSTTQSSSILAATPDDTGKRLLIHLPYSSKTYFDRGNINGGGRLSTTFNTPNSFQLWNFQTETGIGQSIRRNGVQIASDSDTSESFNSAGKTLELSSLISSNAFDGDIAEVIVFNQAFTQSDRNKVDSYLGIKYGLTLDQTTPTNYVTSNGSVIWNAISAGDYKHDIAGIAVDSDSGLNQTQSSSSNDDGIVIVSNPNNLEDGEALMWSNNNAVTDAFNTITTINNYQKIARQWLVQETGEVGTVNLSFDLSNLGYDTSNPDDFVLLIDDDGDFSNAEVSPLNSTIDGDTVTFTGVNLNHNDYFSLAVPQQGTPGNVSNNLQVWLKADSGITTNNGKVSNWQDSSINQRNYSQSTTTRQPVVTNNDINFNPAVTFDGSSHTSSDGDLLATDKITYPEATLFFVVKSNKNSGSLLTDDWYQYAFDLNYGINGKVGVNYYSPGTAYPSSINSPVNEIAIASFNKVSNSGIFNLAIEKDGILTTDAVNTGNSNNSFVNRRLAPSFAGDIAEVIIYDSILDATEETKVRSYLGIKYGLTLDRNTNYLASDNSLWWNATKNNKYNYNIAGIAKDEGSGLNQTQSTSSNKGSVLTVSNPSNLEDGEALIWGSNQRKIQSSYLKLDGVNDYAQIADNDAIDFTKDQNFTVEARVRTTGSTDNDAILEKWSQSGGYPFVIRYKANGTVLAARYDGLKNPTITSTSTINDGEFHHLAFVKEGSNLKLYIDGKLEGTTTDTTTGTTTNSSPLYLGSRGGNLEFFKGDLDDVRIWNVARSEAEIKTFQGGVKPNSTGLVAYLPMENGAVNITSNNHHATLKNEATIINSASQNLPPRIWQVQEQNGDVGTVTVSLDLNQFGYHFTNVAQLSDFALLIGDDESFTNPTFHTTGRSLANNTITFTGVDFNNGDYFTLFPRYNNPDLIKKGNNLSEQIQGSSTKDILNGDNGSDRLYGNAGNDILYGDELNDLLKGGDGNDEIAGGDGSDRLYGENNNDTLSGGNGQDILYGGAGNDFLDGGAANDLLTGNGGSDLFTLIQGGGNDAIYDYLDGTDRLGLPDSLSFSNLTITQVGSHTEIKQASNEFELLGTLYNVNANLINSSDFILV
jgi:hypothetical protein